MKQSISMQTGQKNMENIYILPIYKFTRLNICVYGLHICIYGGLYLCIPTELDIHICSTRPQNAMHKPLALQEAAVSMV